MRAALTALWIGLALWFLFGGEGSGVTELSATELEAGVAPEDIATGPLRSTLGDPPRVVIGGVEQKCSDCHALFASLEVTPSNIRQHTHIELDHGLNDRCYNCHSQSDRNKLVMHDGSLVGFADSTTLCSKCHGTVFRDWERGMHGKTLGSWDASSGRQVRLRCVECHDPHAPAFDPFEALPGPRSRGYRPPDAHAGHGGEPTSEELNPLERWKHRREGASRREAVEGTR